MTLCWKMRRRTADTRPKLVVWDKPASGDPMAPFDNPELHLDRVWYCNEFDYFKVAHQGTHSLTHASVAAKSQSFGTVVMNGQTVAQDQVLYDFTSLGLTAAPRYRIALGGKLIQNYWPVQIVGTDRVRTASFYATSTAIHCINHGTSSSSALASVTVDYEVILFRPPMDGYDPDLPIFSADQFGQGMIRVTDKLLRRSDDADASPFDRNLGPAVDIDRGSARWFIPGSSPVDFGPYGGSAVAPDSIQCVVTG